MIDRELVKSIERESESLGFGKISTQLSRQVAQIVSKERGAGTVRSIPVSDEAAVLARLYQESRSREFLRSDFKNLSPEDKIEWLRGIVANPLYGFDNPDLFKVLGGAGDFAITALIEAYADSDHQVEEYVDSTFEKLFRSHRIYLEPGSIPQIVRDLSRRQPLAQPYQITSEGLKGTSTKLTSFYFRLSSNVYALSYPKKDRIVHTLIDTGERHNGLIMLNLLKNNGIEPGCIETILLTHHHVDHSGLIDLICLVSGAKVLVHPEFEEDKLGETDLPRIGRFMRRLPASLDHRSRRIGGVDFPLLGRPLPIGPGARLETLGLPGGDKFTHSFDQLIFYYSPQNSGQTRAKIGLNFRPTDELLFSGDLWLMQSPIYPELTPRRSKALEMVRQRGGRIDYRPQNRREKDALKNEFSLIVVKPGHGPEFLGARIVGTLNCRRDILVKLGFDENENKRVLKDPKQSASIKEIQEGSYLDFRNELEFWLRPIGENGLGYQVDEVVGFLIRIFREQSGGGRLVSQDRKERRLDLEEKLARLANDPDSSMELVRISGATRESIAKIASPSRVGGGTSCRSRRIVRSRAFC